MSPPTDEEKSLELENDVQILSFHQMVEEGYALSVNPAPIPSDETYTIMYTSGTTGLPKGNFQITLKKNIYI